MLDSYRGISINFSVFLDSYMIMPLAGGNKDFAISEKTLPQRQGASYFMPDTAGKGAVEWRIKFNK
jgi:hypothetical protein